MERFPALKELSERLTGVLLAPVDQLRQQAGSDVGLAVQLIAVRRDDAVFDRVDGQCPAAASREDSGVPESSAADAQREA